MREDPTVCELLGIEAVVGDDTIRRFFAALDPKSSAQWVAQAAVPMWGALPEHLILDWDSNQHEFEAYVTNLEPSVANAWQIVELYRKRADAENVFDELKKQWGFDGFTSRKRAVSELATRLLMLVYNLWNPFLRLMSPERHIEAASGR